jgi:hypothetical protein
MKTFYNKLNEVFTKPETKAKFTSQGISPVGYIDLYAGQDLNEDNFELFTANALFVDWDIDHTSKPPIATLTFYCCYEQLRDTSNISLNQELGLKFLAYKDTIDEVVTTIETNTSGKLNLLKEGFNKMDSIVDIYLLTYECSFNGRKNPLDKYQAGDYNTVDLKPTLNIEFD